MILSLIYPMILGIGRIETSYLLGTNGVFQYLTGLPSYPNATALRRFLRRMYYKGLPKLIELHNRIRTRIVKKLSTMILDMDSTVLTVYGKQEQARVGYNPFKHGRASYHPLLAFEARTQTSWHGLLRAGNTASLTGSDTFLQECFNRKPDHVKRLFVRADAGFYSKETVEMCSKNKAFFVIVAKHTKPLKEEAVRAKYKEFAKGWEQAEFFYEPTGWKKEYRFVAIRYLLPQEEEEYHQPTLFPITIGKYGYRVYVTNMKLKPKSIWRFYRKRANVELIIKELKGDYPLGKIPTKFFSANQSYFHLLLFSYDLVSWFQKLCTPREYKTAGLMKLRRCLFTVVGELIRHGRQPALKLPVRFPHEEVFIYTLKHVQKLVEIRL